MTSGFLSIVSGKVIVMLIGVFTTPILYRLLTTSEFGNYSFVLSVFTVLMIFVSSGVSDGVRKFLAEKRPVPNWEEHIVGFYFRLAVVLAVLGSGGLALAVQTGLVTRFVGAKFTTYFSLLAVLVLTAQFRTYVRRTLMGFGLERYSEPLQVLSKGLNVLGILFVYLGYGVAGMLVGHIVSSLTAVVIGLVLINRRVSLLSVVKRTPSTFPRRELLTFNSLSIMLIFLLTSLYHVDILMLQFLAGSEKVGHYKAALKLAEFLWFVPVAIQTVFVHSTSELWSNDRRERISELAARVTRYTFLLTAVMAVGLAALADVAVPAFFGSKAQPAITPLRLLLPGALGFAVARPILAISQGKGDLKLPIIATGSAAAINLTLNLALIPTYGMTGAAIATSAGYGSMLVFHLWSARRVGFDPLSDARLGRVALTTLVAAAPIWYLSTSIEHDLVALAVVPAVGFLVYVTCAFVTGALGVVETLEVLASFPGPISTYATQLERRVQNPHMRLVSNTQIQHVLLVAGIVLFASGLAFATGGFGIGGSDSPNPDVPANATTGGPVDTTGQQTPTKTSQPPAQTETQQQTAERTTGGQTTERTTEQTTETSASTPQNTAPEAPGGTTEGGASTTSEQTTAPSTTGSNPTTGTETTETTTETNTNTETMSTTTEPTNTTTETSTATSTTETAISTTSTETTGTTTNSTTDNTTSGDMNTTSQ